MYKIIAIATLAIILSGCGAANDVENAADAVKEATEVVKTDKVDVNTTDTTVDTVANTYKYDLWDYVVPLKNIDYTYDLKAYDRDDNLLDTRYGWMTLTYEYTNATRIIESSNIYVSLNVITTDDNILAMDNEEFNRYVDAGYSNGRCEIHSSKIEDTIEMLCDLDGNVDVRFFKKYKGMVGRMTFTDSTYITLTLYE